MQIGIVITAHNPGFGGAERSMLRLAQSLVLNGHNVCAFVPLTNVPVAEAFIEIGASLRPLSLASCLGFADSARHCDVIYVMGARRGILWTFLASVVAGVPAIGSERSSGVGLLNGVCHLLSSLWCTAIISNSSVGSLKTATFAAGFCQVIKIPNGVIPPRIEVMERDIDIVCLANLTANKGQVTLLEAVNLLQPEFPGLCAHLYGIDYTEGVFLKTVEERSLSSRMVYHGVVKDVWPVLSRAKVCCLPTLYYEGLPTCLVEASFAGAAIVASDVGGCSDVCVHEQTGLLVPPGDSSSLASALGLILSNSTLRHRLATAAGIKADEEFNITTMRNRHLSVFFSATQ